MAKRMRKFLSSRADKKFYRKCALKGASRKVNSTQIQRRGGNNKL